MIKQDDETWWLHALYKNLTKVHIGGCRPDPQTPQPKMWHFAE